ncbi:hypothetical protein FACS189415_4400 [Bacteroidia bacterium]|nr:hypothetical protein FACS189415_4400 [Bacteroidia bacterium]
MDVVGTVLFFIILFFIILMVNLSSWGRKIYTSIQLLEKEVRLLKEALAQEQKAETVEQSIVPLVAVQPVPPLVKEEIEGLHAELKEATEELIFVMPSIASEEKETVFVSEPTAEPINEPTIEPLVEPAIEQPVEAPPVIDKAPVKKSNDFEKFFGENLLSKIGIATLVLGISYFVKYAIDRDWIDEVGRVVFGLLCGGVIIGIGHKLKDNYRVFSSILVGGGISVLYITITIAYRQYGMYSQSLSFSLLIFVTALSVFLALLYGRKELAIFSLLGGFASPLLASSGTSNYVVLFSYLLILNSGMLVLAFKKQWDVLGMIAYILTLLFFWWWLLTDYFYLGEYLGAIIFAVLFYVQFYALALIHHYRGGKKLKAFHSFIILSNNLSLFAAALFIFYHWSSNPKGIITLGMAVLNVIPLVILWLDKTVDRRLVYLVIANVLLFVSLAIPMQLHGSFITMLWGAETTVVLWLWKKSDIRVFKSAFLLLEFAALASLLGDWDNFYSYVEPDILLPLFNTSVVTGIFITITLWVNGYIYPSRNLSYLAVGMLFITLLLELQYRMGLYYPDWPPFRYLIYGLYVYLYVAVLTGVYWKLGRLKGGLSAGAVLLSLSYVTVYSFIVNLVRRDVMFDSFADGIPPSWGYVGMHYPALVCLAFFLVFLLLTKGRLSNAGKNKIYWFVAIVSVITLSLEADTVILMLFSEAFSEADLLETSHNIVYPVLWGITGLALMITGMKKKIRTLRIISLTLFVLIIAKLYLYDIWQMSQTGRIIALVILGIIFLLVSFLYQKLKILLQKEEDLKAEAPEEPV